MERARSLVSSAHVSPSLFQIKRGTWMSVFFLIVWHTHICFQNSVKCCCCCRTHAHRMAQMLNLLVSIKAVALLVTSKGTLTYTAVDLAAVIYCIIWHWWIRMKCLFDYRSISLLSSSWSVDLASAPLINNILRVRKRVFLIWQPLIPAKTSERPTNIDIGCQRAVCLLSDAKIESFCKLGCQIEFRLSVTVIECASIDLRPE